MNRSRSASKRYANYRRALDVGIRMGLEAAEREAVICGMSWDGVAAQAANVLADQIRKLEIPEELIRQTAESRDGEVSLSTNRNKPQSESPRGEQCEKRSHEVQDT